VIGQAKPGRRVLVYQRMQHKRDNADMDLPSRLRACIEHWHLQLDSQLAGGFRSEVFACAISAPRSDHCKAEISAALLIHSGAATD